MLIFRPLFFRAAPSEEINLCKEKGEETWAASITIVGASPKREKEFIVISCITLHRCSLPTHTHTLKLTHSVREAVLLFLEEHRPDFDHANV